MLKEQGMLILILAWVMQRKSSKFINFKQTGQKTCCLIGQKQLAFAHGIEQKQAFLRKCWDISEIRTLRAKWMPSIRVFQRYRTEPSMASTILFHMRLLLVHSLIKARISSSRLDYSSSLLHGLSKMQISAKVTIPTLEWRYHSSLMTARFPSNVVDSSIELFSPRLQVYT